MHILYLSHYFPPEMGAPAARVHELSREWARLGHRVTVITGFPNHPTGVIPPEYRGRVFQRERIDGIEVVRTWLYAAPNKGTAKRILNYASFMATSLLLGVPVVRTCDVVVATSPQFFVAVAGYAASRLMRRPFVFEVRDLWPDSIEAVGAIRNRAVIWSLRQLEEFLYRRAAKIVGVARSTPRILAERGFDPGKMAVIPNGVDLDFFRPGPRDNDVRRKHVPDGGFLASYVGTHGMAHALNTMLDAAAMLKDRGDIRFMLVGEGAEKERLVARSREMGLSNVVFVGQQPRAMLPAFYQASDACLVPLRKTPLFQAVLPSKMFEIMAMAKPILLSVEGEAKELLEDAGAGFAIPPESAVALRDAVIQLADDPGLCRALGDRGRAYVEASYSRAVLAEKYAALLEELLRERGITPR